MDRRIRILALLLIACFCLLFLQLNNWQVRQAGSLQSLSNRAPYGAPAPSEFTQPRGDIVSADGTLLADSTPTNDEYQELRHYPQGSLFAAVTGYYDATQFGDSGIEAEYDQDLLVHQSTAGTPSQLLTQHSGTDTVVLTVSDALQKAAQSALGGLHGAVVAIDPQTGAVLAMYGSPTFDPNKLASHNAAAVLKYWNSLDPNSGTSPLINSAVGQTVAPGSTFKVITTAAIYDHNPSVALKVWPVQSSITLPQTPLRLQNFGGEKCGGDLANALAVSCDTAYAQIGVAVGAQALADEAASFGFNEVPPIDLPPGEVAPACFPPVNFSKTVPGCSASTPIGAANIPGIAYSAIGQEDVTETALQDALVAAAIGDQGQIMTPHLLAHVVNDEGTVISSYNPHVWKQATSAATADQVRNLMLGVVTSGTASAVGFPAGLDVAAKTGTAETGAAGCSSTWFIATAPAGPTDIPKIAVAASVPSQPGVSCGETGAEVAGPVVKSVIDTYFGVGQ